MANLIQEIEAQITGAKAAAIKRNVGMIREIGDGVARVEGLGDAMLNELNVGGLLSRRWFKKFAVEGYPACGTPQEALQHHGLDGASLAMRISSDCNSTPERENG